LTFAFAQYPEVSHNLAQLPSITEVEICHQLLDCQMHTIRSLWQPTLDAGIPIPSELEYHLLG
jgi:hypothetical protein